MSVTGLVLAAGGSLRLGRPKQLLPVGDGTLLDATLSTVRRCGLDQVVVAVGGAADAVLESVDLGGCDVVRNDAYGAGCSSSISAALPVVEPSAEGIVLFLGDQPLVQPSTVAALVARARTTELAVCSYDDGLGHPFWLGRGLFDRLATLHGDKAVWKLVDAAGDALVTVSVRGPVPIDVDTEEDYRALLEQQVRFGATMTPTQLRAFATVVRLGSVKAAAADLGVTEAAVSLHVGQLRRELGDQLFNRTASGLAFTPGGLRLASRAVEMLGLQDRTVLEVREAGAGRRMLRLGTSALFAEYAAPGLISLFAERAKDLDVELSVHPTGQFEQLLVTRTVDATIGPRPARSDSSIASTQFLNYEVIAVAAPDHRFVQNEPSVQMLRDETWLLGPSAAEESGVVPSVIRRIGVPEERQQIFQSHAAALEETKRGRGMSLTLSFTVAPDLAARSLVRIAGPHLRAQGAWNISTLPGQQATPSAEEMTRFVTTPRAIQSMLRGRAVAHGRFHPAVHVTLWS